MSLGQQWVANLQQNYPDRDDGNRSKRAGMSSAIETSAAEFFGGLRNGVLRRYIDEAAGRGSDCTAVEVEGSVLGSQAFAEFRAWASDEGLDVSVGWIERDGDKGLIISLAPASSGNES